MKIQVATTEDSGILTEITKKSKAYWGYSPKQIIVWKDLLTISEKYIENSSIFKLVKHDKMIGYYSYVYSNKNTIKLDNLFIMPDYIGRGLGKYLMQDFLERVAIDINVKIITLDSDPNAESFYLKMGFKTVGKIKTSIKNRFMPIMTMDMS